MGTRMHDVVHTSLLKLFRNQDNNTIEVDDEEDDLFLEVESIVYNKQFEKVIKYRVKWKGYDKADDNWELFKNIK